jgi:hypothetical protein
MLLQFAPGSTSDAGTSCCSTIRPVAWNRAQIGALGLVRSALASRRFAHTPPAAIAGVRRAATASATDWNRSSRLQPARVEPTPVSNSIARQCHARWTSREDLRSSTRPGARRASRLPAGACGARRTSSQARPPAEASEPHRRAQLTRQAAARRFLEKRLTSASRADCRMPDARRHFERESHEDVCERPVSAEERLARHQAKRDLCVTRRMAPARPR